MKLLESPTPWWWAALLAPPLLVLAERALPPIRGLPDSVRLTFFLALLVLAPYALGSAARRRSRAQGGAPDPEVVRALREVHEARVAVHGALAALAQAGPAQPGPSTSAPAPRARRVPIVLVGALVFLVASGGLAVAFLHVPAENLPSSTNPYHVHASFAVYVRGERVDFSDPAFDLDARGFLMTHLHVVPVPDQDLLHLELRPNQPLDEALDRATGVRLAAGRLTLDDAVHGGRSYSDGPEEKLRVFVAHDLGDAWTEPAEGIAYKVRDGDRILVTYGTADDETLEMQKESVARRKG